MRPVLITVRGLRVWSYPALLYTGMVSGFYVMYLLSPGFGINRDQASLALLILYVPALLGARLWFVVDHWPIYRTDRRRIWRRSEGGLTLYGGLILAVLASPLLLRSMDVGFAGFWDAST